MRTRFRRISLWILIACLFLIDFAGRSTAGNKTNAEASCAPGIDLINIVPTVLYPGLKCVGSTASGSVEEVLIYVPTAVFSWIAVILTVVAIVVLSRRRRRRRLKT